MKEETRYRVTGSLFLLALAVIFLPMLFDGAGLPRVELEPVAPPPIAAVELPEPPTFDPELPVRVEALAEQVDPEGFHTETGTRLGEPVLSEAGSSTEAWAVQVASFAEAENARRLRERLREDGYEAFLSTLRSGADVRIRVAVGPFQSRAEAARFQSELSSRYRVNARLMGFSI